MLKFIFCLILGFLLPVIASSVTFRAHPVMLVGTERDERGDYIGISCTAQVLNIEGERYLTTARHCMKKNRFYIFENPQVIHQIFTADKTKVKFRLFLKSVLQKSFQIDARRFQIPRAGLNDVVSAKLKHLELKSIQGFPIARQSPQLNQTLFLEGFPFGNPKIYSPCLYKGAHYTPAESQDFSAAIGHKVFCENAQGFQWTPGLSGAAVLNQNNEVVGITTIASHLLDKHFSYEDLTQLPQPGQSLVHSPGTSIYSDKSFDSIRFSFDSNLKMTQVSVQEKGQVISAQVGMMTGQTADDESSVENQLAVLLVSGQDVPSEESVFLKTVRRILRGYAEARIDFQPARFETEQIQFMKDTDEVDSALLTLSFDYQGQFVPRFWPGAVNKTLRSFYRLPKSKNFNSTICEANWELFDAGRAYTNLLSHSAPARRKWVSVPQNADGSMDHPNGVSIARVMTCVRNGRLASHVAVGSDPDTGVVTLYQEHNLDQANPTFDDRDDYAFTRIPERSSTEEYRRAIKAARKILSP